MDEVDEVTRDQVETLIRRSKYLDLDPDIIPEAIEEKTQAKAIDYRRLKEALLQFAPEAEKSDSKNRYKPAQFLSDKKFGHILYRLGLIKSEDLAKAITLQSELKQNGVQKRIGEILVEKLEVLRSEQLDVLVSALERAKECLVSSV